MKASQGGSSSSRVLVLDDDEDSTEVLCCLLRAIGHEAHACNRGQEALALVDELAPTIVLVDLLLGDMTGYDVARALRSRPDGRDLYLVAVTGLGRPADRELAVKAGFDRYIVKPLDLRTLRSIVVPGTRDELPSRGDVARGSTNSSPYLRSDESTLGG